MANRTNVNSIRPVSSGEEKVVVPWEDSGVLVDNAVIKNKPGLFGGIVINFVWGLLGELSIRPMIGGNDWPFPVPPAAPPWWLVVWDSPDEDTTGDVVLARYSFPSGAYLGTVVETMFPPVGVYAHLGIYVQVSAVDDFEYVVSYR